MHSLDRCRWLALLAAGALLGCRDAQVTNTGVRLVPSSHAASGCSGPDQQFAPPQLPAAVTLGTLVIGPLSQVAAAGDSETLFATGVGATVVAIDVSAALPVETELVAAGEVATLLATAGIVTAPELSGICVLDADSLLVMEHTSNTILRVDRNLAVAVSFFAGAPDEAGGFADGTAEALGGTGQARFHFRGASQLIATDPLTPFVFVADTGNHAIRRISSGFVRTIAGTGAPFFADGELRDAGFDSPNGLSVTCGGALLVTESGAGLAGGRRLRQIILGPSNFFGQTGTVLTRAGDGLDATLGGNGLLASLAAPTSPLATSQADTYWIDAGTGILRRMAGSLDTCDCPLWVDCAAAVTAGGEFTPGGVLSLAQTGLGLLYVLDASASTLLRVTP